jgi:hypothetical protein
MLTRYNALALNALEETHEFVQIRQISAKYMTQTTATASMPIPYSV